MRLKLVFGKKVDWRLTIKLILMRLRREFLITFRPRYILKQIQSRKGSCTNKFGCSILAEKTPFSCKFMNKDGSCRAWKKPEFPLNCFIGPIDEKDKYCDECGICWEQ